ncbi:putative DNA-binding pseudobarrel domain superfamily [Helianthus anomalus]
MLSCTVHTLKGEMVYGFKLPADYGEWIKTFSYPEKNAVIWTLDGRIFKVKVMNIAGDYFLYNGWLDLVTSLKLPSNSWVVFQYEEALSSFRLFYFYQDISLVLSEYFYYKLGNVKERDNCMVLEHILFQTILSLHSYIVLYIHCFSHVYNKV